jgi:hypothetical protein
MKNEKWDDVHGNTTPDDRMVAFLESPTDSYAILQLREDVDDNIPLMLANYSYLQKKEMEPEIDRYEVVSWLHFYVRGCESAAGRFVCKVQY